MPAGKGEGSWTHFTGICDYPSISLLSEAGAASLLEKETLLEDELPKPDLTQLERANTAADRLTVGHP